MQEDRHRGMLGEKFEGLGAAPSAGLWDAISDSLDGKKKKKAFIWWWIGPGIAAIGIFGFLICFQGDTNAAGMAQNQRENTTKFTKSDKSILPLDQGQLQENTLLVNKAETALEMENNATGINAKTPVKSTNYADASDDLPRIDKAEKELGNPLEELKALNENDYVVFNENVFEGEEVEKEKKWVLQGDVDRAGLGKLLKNDYPIEPLACLPITNNKKRLNSWEVGLGVSYWRTFKESVDNNNYAVSNSDTTFVGPVDTVITVSLDNGPEGGSQNVGVYSSQNRKSIQLHLGYAVNPELRLVSGLSYEESIYTAIQTNVFFTGTTQDAGNISAKTVKTTALVLPIGAEYDFLKRRRFKLGAGATVVNEFPLRQIFGNGGASALETSIGSMGNKNAEKYRLKGYSLGTQVSLNTSYALTEKLRVQVNTGVRGYLRQKAQAFVTLPKRKLWFGGMVNLIWKF